MDLLAETIERARKKKILLAKNISSAEEMIEVLIQ